MPPKPKFKKDAIVEIAFAYVRKNGWGGLTARYLSEQLGSSTMPIYSSFKSMRHLEEAVVERAMTLYRDYVTTPRTGDVWIDHGVGYILFALKEKHLFRSVFDEAHSPLRIKYSQSIWEELGKRLATYPPFAGLSEGQVLHLRRGRFVLMHGIACLINTGSLPFNGEDEIPDMVKTASQVMLSGVIATFD
jgi:AcrR family transcriptional regulator